MKLAKLFSFLLLVVFFISSASAVLVYGDWQDGSQSLTVTQGEDVSFYADFATINPPMKLNIFVLDSNYNTIEYIENDLIIDDYSYASTYILDTGSYSAGKYSIVLNGEDKRSDTDVHTLYLTIKEKVVVDKNAPIVEITSPIQGKTYDYLVGTLTYTANDPEGNLVDCKYSKGSFTSQWASCTGTYDIVSQEGENTFRVYARDSYGNIGSDTVTFTVNTTQIDNPPFITILGDNPLNLTLGESYVEYGATAYDAEDGNLTSEIETNPNDVDTNTVGNYNVVYTVTDSAGNTVQKIRTVNVFDSEEDTTPPVIEVLVPENLTYNFTEFVFEVLVNEKADVVFNLNDEGNVSMTEIHTGRFISGTLNLLEGNHVVTFYATDLAGNVGYETVSFTVDLNESFEFLLEVILPKEGKEYDEDITFKVETNAESQVVFSLNDEPNITMNFEGENEGVFTFTYSENLVDGEHEIIFYATDLNGNVLSETVSFTVDDSSRKKKDDDKKIIDDDFYKDKYLEDLNYVNTPIHLEEEDSSEELTLCQKFLIWFKNTFGFEFFFFMFGLFFLLCILLLIYIFKKYREYYL
jgi:hypothetical protein